MNNMLENFLHKIIKGNGIEPPESCAVSLRAKFDNINNIEWFKKDNNFEAIFYKDNLEHVALFSVVGELVEYKMFLPVNYLSDPIRAELEAKGEIMNIVLRNRGNLIEYETIIRDKNLNRYLITLTNLGKIIDEHKL